MKVLMFLLGLCVAVVIYEIQKERPINIEEGGIEVWKLADVVPNLNDNECTFVEGSPFKETVHIYYPEKTDEVNGRWNEDVNVIELMQPTGLDVETVAHEVSHMVDSFMIKYNVQDPHFEAYMQGYWTECVMKIMEDDIAIFESGRFRFAE